MLLAALADGRAVDYMSFIGLWFTAMRCNHPHTGERAVRLRWSLAKSRSTPFSTQFPPRLHYAQTSSNGPESSSVAARSREANGLCPGPATPARLPGGLPAQI